MISVRDICKSFGTQTVLANANLEIPKGKTTAIVGPSGVGKSVLLKLIMGISKPDHGSIYIDDLCISELRSEDDKNVIRQKLGVLFQSAALFDSLTIYDNIIFPLRQRLFILDRTQAHAKVAEMLESLSLAPFALKYPQEVSLGIRKRAGIARALITKPEIFLFDEPNTGLDPLVGQEVYDLIKECQKTWNFTGVVISHELPEVFQVSDRVAMLLGGNFIFEGTPSELKSSTDAAVQQFLHGRVDGPISIQ